MKNWCKKTNGLFMGSLKIGAGEVLGHKNILSSILSPLFKHKINKFAKYINKNKKINLKTSLIISKKMFCRCANLSFKKQLDKYSKVW